MSDTLRCWNGRRFLTGTCDELLQSRLVSLHGPILKDNSLNLIAQLLYLDNQSPRLPIYLNVSSPGGCVGSSFAVVDTIRDLNAPVHTICRGLVAGTVVMIAAAGAIDRDSHIGIRSFRLSRQAMTKAIQQVHKNWNGSID